VDLPLDPEQIPMGLGVRRLEFHALGNYYGLNAYIPLNSSAEILTLKCHGIRRWGLGQVIRS
jgi:hypothetical protein